MSLVDSARSWFKAGYQEGKQNGLKSVASQGMVGEVQAVIGFFAILVVGIFVLSEIDTSLPQSSGNYSDAANQTSGGFKDTVDIAVVVPIVAFAGLLLGAIMRFV